MLRYRAAGCRRARGFFLCCRRQWRLSNTGRVPAWPRENARAGPLARRPGAELHCGRRNDRLLGVEGRLCAEAATHVRRDHTDCLKVAFEEIGKRRAAKVRRLRRRPHRQHVSSGIVTCEHGAAFEGHGPAAMQEKFVLEDVCGARECRLNVAVAHGDDSGDIARQVAVCGRSIGPRGFAAVADRRQRLEVHVDGCGGVFREIAIVCDRDRDGLTDIAHFTARQGELRARRRNRWIRHEHRNLAARHACRQIVGGQHRMDAWHGTRRECIEGADLGVSVRAAHEARV